MVPLDGAVAQACTAVSRLFRAVARQRPTAPFVLLPRAMRPASHKAIGVFDSGVGGLTVLRALLERLPHESTVYLGDTARVPYGTKSAEVVTRYSLANARF